MDFMTTVMRGFNERENETRYTERYMDLSTEQFQEVCKQALQNVDSTLEAVVITSWNDFTEGTNIEPTEEYGHTPLNIVKEELAMKEADPLHVNDYSLMELDFNRTFKPSEINNESTDERDLAFMAGGMEFLSEDNSISYDIGVPGAEPVFVHGAYNRGESDESSPSSWRWFGGPDALTATYVVPDSSDASEARLYGNPLVANEIEADIFYNGQHTDHIVFDDRKKEIGKYQVSLQN
jgi:hypothetical protein